MSLRTHKSTGPGRKPSHVKISPIWSISKFDHSSVLCSKWNPPEYQPEPEPDSWLSEYLKLTLQSEWCHNAARLPPGYCQNTAAGYCQDTARKLSKYCQNIAWISSEYCQLILAKRCHKSVRILWQDVWWRQLYRLQHSDLENRLMYVEISTRMWRESKSYCNIYMYNISLEMWSTLALLDIYISPIYLFPGILTQCDKM